jgi:hypothetical protein
MPGSTYPKRIEGLVMNIAMRREVDTRILARAIARGSPPKNTILARISEAMDGVNFVGKTSRFFAVFVASVQGR